MAAYILRKIEDDLWTRVKARSLEDNIPLRAIIVALLTMYAEGKVNVKASVVKATRS